MPLPTSQTPCFPSAASPTILHQANKLPRSLPIVRPRPRRMPTTYHLPPNSLPTLLPRPMPLPTILPSLSPSAGPLPILPANLPSPGPLPLHHRKSPNYLLPRKQPTGCRRMPPPPCDWTLGVPPILPRLPLTVTILPNLAGIRARVQPIGFRRILQSPCGWTLGVTTTPPTL
jgi:hypothetical protein